VEGRVDGDAGDADPGPEGPGFVGAEERETSVLGALLTMGAGDAGLGGEISTVGAGEGVTSAEETFGFSAALDLVVSWKYATTPIATTMVRMPANARLS